MGIYARNSFGTFVIFTGLLSMVFLVTKSAASVNDWDIKDERREQLESYFDNFDSGVSDEFLEKAWEIDKLYEAVPLKTKSDEKSEKNHGITFEVDDVTKSNHSLRRTSPVRVMAGWPEISENCTKFESVFQSAANLVNTRRINQLALATHMAYSSHYPLVLSPDVIWLTIMQGLAIHVNENAEQLRDKWVKHEGKKELIVKEGFQKGSPYSPWETAAYKFSEAIRQEIGDDLYDIVTPNFTTTGPLEKAVTDIVLMNTLKKYFKFTFVTLCGIPSITLQGEPNDWIKIRAKAAELKRFGLDWWLEHLIPVLDQFVKASQGDIDNTFWSRIYKHVLMGSGGDLVSGWIIALFPYYTVDGEWRTIQDCTYEYTAGFPVGVDGYFNCPGLGDLGDLPSGLSEAPFQWNYLETPYDMAFYGGLVGMSQDPDTLALQPEFGWAVCDNT